MKFNITDWYNIYKKVNYFGAKLRDSKRNYDCSTKSWIPCKSLLSEEEQVELEKKIKNLIIKNNNYLDACGLRKKEPKWVFSIDDPRTWPSHDSFIYKHLLD